jgi:hypothetical protein
VPASRDWRGAGVSKLNRQTATATGTHGGGRGSRRGGTPGRVRRGSVHSPRRWRHAGTSCLSQARHASVSSFPREHRLIQHPPQERHVCLSSLPGECHVCVCSLTNPLMRGRHARHGGAGARRDATLRRRGIPPSRSDDVCHLHSMRGPTRTERHRAVGAVWTATRWDLGRSTAVRCCVAQRSTPMRRQSQQTAHVCNGRHSQGAPPCWLPCATRAWARQYAILRWNSGASAGVTYGRSRQAAPAHAGSGDRRGVRYTLTRRIHLCALHVARGVAHVRRVSLWGAPR